MQNPEGLSTTGYLIPARGEAKSCSMLMIMAVTAVWIIVNTILFSMVGWFVEQFMFEGSFELPDAVRWGIGLAGSLLVLLPCATLAVVIKSQPGRAVYLSWLFASIFALLSIPGRLVGITSSQTAALIQIAGILVYLAALTVFIFRKRKDFISGWWRITPGGVGFALFSGVLLLIPWVLWGALGSLLDLILVLAISLLTAAAAVLTLATLLFPITLNQKEYRRQDFIWDGFAAAVMLLIMIGGLGQSGNQWLLLVVVPLTGFLLAAVGIAGRKMDLRFNWLAGIISTGLVIAWPILWFDSDELMLVTSMGAGEALEWAGLAVFTALLIEILFIICFTVFFKKLEIAAGTSRVMLLLTGFIVVIVVSGYFLVGRPGWHGERLFVILKDQADVSSAANIPNYVERRNYVYQTLVNHARKSQVSLRSDLQQLGIEHQPYYLVNAVEVPGSPLLRLWLNTRSDVDRVLDSPILRPLPAQPPSASGTAQAPQQPEWNLTDIGAPAVWTQTGARGQGIVIGQSDSGVQGNHPDLAVAYRGRNQGDDYNWFDPWNHSRQPVDIGGHGTHTLGIILGQRTGVAPGAEWIGCVNLARNLGNPAVYLDCWQFLLAPYPQNGDAFINGDPARGAHVLNNSWGCPPVEGCDPATYLPAVKALKAAGIFVVVSAGNSGTTGCGSVSDPPSVYDEVLTVGAVNRYSQLADFSSIGPVTVDNSRRIKPDLVAPGEDVLSTFPNSTYAKNSGTSMAGPHVAGVVALMWSANPALIGNIDVTRSILVQTASSYNGKYPSCVSSRTAPNNAVGYGVVNALEAVKSALAPGKKQ